MPLFDFVISLFLLVVLAFVFLTLHTALIPPSVFETTFWNLRIVGDWNS
jgi:hypothetical protein